MRKHKSLQHNGFLETINLKKKQKHVLQTRECENDILSQPVIFPVTQKLWEGKKQPESQDSVIAFEYI